MPGGDIGMDIVIGFVFFVVVTSIVILADAIREPRNHVLPERPRLHVLKSLIERFNKWTWWVISWRIRHHDELVKRRLTLIATGNPDIDPTVNGTHTVTSSDWNQYYSKIYEVLNILNHKAEALMVYGGVTLAVLSVANLHSETTKETCFSVVIACFILVSILCCLNVVGIFWGFLEYAIRPPLPGGQGTEPYRATYKAEWDRLLEVVVVRQFYYQLGWFLSVISWVLLLIFILIFGL
jgi:hypothetical protein